jgi:hypothetical protein
VCSLFFSTDLIANFVFHESSSWAYNVEGNLIPQSTEVMDRFDKVRRRCRRTQFARPEQSYDATATALESRENMSGLVRYSAGQWQIGCDVHPSSLYHRGRCVNGPALPDCGVLKGNHQQ